MNWRRLINLAGVKKFSKPELSHPGNQKAYQLFLFTLNSTIKHNNQLRIYNVEIRNNHF